jgi:hypothetical protein
MMDFRNAYVELVNSAHAVPRGLTMAALEPAPGVSPNDWTRMYSEASKTAGAAAMAYRRYGGTFTLRNAAYIMNAVDPVANWEMSIKDPQQLEPTAVISTVEAAIARARQEAQEAVERERGLTGFIAAFLRWPSTLREAVGPGHGAQRTAAGAIGILGQVVVGAITAGLTAGLVAGVVAIWRIVF